MSDLDRWRTFCFVGIGNHARTKLIPAVLENDQELVGLVSTKAAAELPCAPVFARLDEALRALPSDTVFVISSPPLAHYEQAMAILSAGRDVVIEKPAFVRSHDTQTAGLAAQAKQVVLAEAFMHRHTRMYGEFMKEWESNRGTTTSLELSFIIPEVPANTFRSQPDISSSLLFDIGSYIVSLLVDVSLPVEQLEVTHVGSNGGPNPVYFELAGILDGVQVRARIGLGPHYQNFVALEGPAARRSFQPFFYGRPGRRTIRMGSGAETEFDDDNAFRNLFATPRTRWLQTQESRLASMAAVTKTLERLGASVANWRDA